MSTPRYEHAFRRWVEVRGARWEELRYPRPEAGGETYAYRLSPPEPRARVVFAHGAGNSALFPQVGFFKALLQEGVEIFAFDLDGHGIRSTTRFAPEIVGGSVPAALEVAAGTTPLPTHLIGHSFGGALSLAAATEMEVESLTLISAPLRIFPSLRWLLAEVGAFFSPTVQRQRPHYGLWGMIPAVGPFKRGKFPLRLVRPEPGYPAQIQETLDLLDLEGAAGRVRVPALLAYGERDRLVPASQGRRLADSIPGAELLLLDAGHFAIPFAGEVWRRIVRQVTG